MNRDDSAFGVHLFAPAFETQDSLGHDDVFKSLANRFVHSTAYLYLYASMAFISFVTVVLSLVYTCPGPQFYILELVVNVALVAEVAIRLVAFGKHFWKSAYNTIDLALVVVCIITLVVLFFNHGCSPYQQSGLSEELIDSILLIVRNVVQCARLVSVIRRGRQNVATRVTEIDLADAHGYSLDVDLDTESMLAQQRMLDGGQRAEPGWGPRTQVAAHTTHNDRPLDTFVAVDDDGEL
ncbi:hypothetical protein MCUN1_002877 [Malassezia cuniculi]|uniref:Ion transport domain-containing protein n=1 Tax=Malassezia cuniculi TaxID=948313 RepID=A0AAF0ESK2_9BASI|nr:hypothetical protein MCUN1_002877 [Malassezia cuniculi]